MIDGLGFSFSQGISLANTGLNILFDAFGKRQNANSGEKISSFNINDIESQDNGNSQQNQQIIYKPATEQPSNNTTNQVIVIGIITAAAIGLTAWIIIDNNNKKKKTK